jgi:hypothetical protein
MTAPTKGTVWLHNSRKDWNGNPLELTVTWIGRGNVYSRDQHYHKVKTPVEAFDKFCLEVKAVPDQKSMQAPALSLSECAALFMKAHAAGMGAGQGCKPVPMVVQQRDVVTGEVIKTYEPIMDGVCGFASVIVRPGTSAFARYLKTSHGAHKHYYGGTEYWIGFFGQSYERKRAYGIAFAEVLNAAGVDAYVHSALD